MGKKATLILVIALILVITTPMLLMISGIVPNPFQDTTPTPLYSFDLPIEGYLTDMYDESPTVTQLELKSIKIYTCADQTGANKLYKETVTSTAAAGGRFRTTQTYQSKTWVMFIVDGSDLGSAACYGNESLIAQMPEYKQEYPPTYHYLSSILTEDTIRLKLNPTLLPRVYKPTGATMTLGLNVATADWDISTDGSLVTFTLEVYSSVEEAGLQNWYDYDEGYMRQSVFVLYIPKTACVDATDGATAAVGQDGVMVTSSSIALTKAKAPTTSQDGIWVCSVPENAVDIDKNQATGLYTIKNTFKIDITFNFASCGASANFTICWAIWKNTNLNNWQQTGLDTSGDAEMFTHTSYLLAIAA